MKKDKRNYKMYLKDIQLSMERIAEYIKDYNYIRFRQDFKTSDAVTRNFEIIGEASKQIPDDIKEKYSYIPWLEMYYLRNKITHEYFGIDYALLWDIASNYLPNNKKQIDEIIKQEYIIDDSLFK
ncbi:MAG: DUF86 domain-containing protein [Ignavibacteriae bacterium]|nr:DUF86 domain-containing protein [Ignavibacteriota bacterium]